VLVSFRSPTPAGFAYLGRNHVFVEQLCRLVMAHTLSREGPRAARAAVMRTHAVAVKTTLLLFRCRSVIEAQPGQPEMVGEEMLLWGWRGTLARGEALNAAAAMALLAQARAASELSPQARAAFLDHEHQQLQRLQDAITELAWQRARGLLQAHERFSALVDTHRPGAVRPVLPMDLLGMYVLLPQAPQ
jgi:hypothetical protein